ncbi:MAG: GntR family transcriptional regulator [Betaproteobacteria bacterium RIFCSPLOWO2_12_FULL_64_23]|nr:MAG: GntR family transcriptional regulator [Betaproteobacteria bacterium RIFCSPLOWO2_12_FULL_64_23]
MSTPAPTFSPLYLQIKRLIMQSLESAEWRPGEAIPSEIELAARYKVSQGTVRKAIDELAAEKHLLRRQGKGTFVATHDEARAQFRFLRLMPDEGEQEWPVSRLLDCKRARASAEIARLLELRAGDGVVVIRRVLSFADEPTVFEQIFLPGALFRNLSAAIFNEYKGSMYKLFETEFGTRMIRAEEKIRAVAADATAAELLRVAADAPLLCVERVAFSYGEKPVEFRRGYYRTDKYYYRNELG